MYKISLFCRVQVQNFTGLIRINLEHTEGTFSLVMPPSFSNNNLIVGAACPKAHHDKIPLLAGHQHLREKIILLLAFSFTDK